MPIVSSTSSIPRASCATSSSATASGSAAPRRTATTSSSTTSSTKKGSAWTTSCRRPWSVIPSGRRIRRTTGRCRRWPTRWAGPIVRTGSRGPSCRQNSRTNTDRELAPPKTWMNSSDIAEFFQGREIDGKKVYGAYIFTERGSEGITMGVTNVLYDCGFKYQDPKKPYAMDGFVNSPEAVKGLEFYKAALQVLHRAGHDQRLHAGRSRRVQVRPGRDADELVRFLPGPVQGPERRRRQDRLLRQSGGPTGQATQLGGQGISVVSYSEQARRRSAIHQVVRAAGRAEEVVGARRLFGGQVGGERTRLRQQRAVRAGSS